MTVRTPTKATSVRKTAAKKVPLVAKRVPVRKAVKRVVSTMPLERHPLAHKVPPMFWSERYINRQIGGMKDVNILRYAMETQENTIIFGPTGTGKTMCVEAYCAEDQLPLVVVQCHGGIDPSVLFGLSKMASGTSSFEESEITQVMRYGGVLYWDEVNFTPARINAVWQSVADARRQVTIQELGNMSFDLHPNCQIIATYNPGYEGTRPLNPAFKNRFATKLFFDYSREVEERLVNKMPVLLEIADRLRGAYESGDVETPVATNMLVEFQDHAIDLGSAVAEMIFVNAFAEHERAAVQKHVEHLRDRISEERNDACGDGDDIIPEEDEDA